MTSIINFKSSFNTLLFILFFNSITFIANASDTIRVLSREPTEKNNVFPSLHEEQLAWLREKKTLTLAISQPDNPPLSITSRSAFYEGVTADVIGLISNNLGVEVVVKKYPHRIDAIKAVKNGEADFVPSANSYDVSEDLILTRPYLDDYPALYKRVGIEISDIKSIAVVEAYLPFSELLRYLPKSTKITTYPSRYSAVASVEYGKSDAVLIDMISGNYIINNFYNNSIHLAKKIYTNTGGFSFGIKKGNDMLLNILNSSLMTVSNANRKSILDRWSGGGLSIDSQQVSLTQQEWEWIYNKGKLTIVSQTRFPPLSYLDVKGNIHGMIVDMSEILSSKLGIPVNVLPVNTIAEQYRAIEHGQADLMLSMTYDSRQKQYLISHAFITEPLVYIVNIKNKGIPPEVFLNIGHVALINDFSPSKALEKKYKIERKSYFNKIQDALACVANRSCDVVLMPFRMAKFLINSDYRDSLTIAGDAFDSIPINVGFAVNKSQETLIGIVDKILYSIPPDEIDKLSTSWRVNAKNEVYTFIDMLRDFGFSFFVVLTTSSIFILLGVGLWRQVTQKKRISHALDSQLKFIGELIDSNPHPIYARNLNGRLILCNNSYAEFIGMQKSELIGTSIDELNLLRPFLSELGNVFFNVLEEGKSQDGDYTLHFSGKKIDIYHWLQSPKEIPTDNQVVIGGWIDISERVTLLSELASASNNALDANKAKSTFLATMSHEIRTPMNAIIGLLELTLRKGRLKSEDHESISLAYQASFDLLALIGDILDISKIESGKLELSATPHNLSVLTQSVINVFSSNARLKNLTIKFSVNQDLTVLIDPNRYKQIISNLLGNAIKFTEKGGITIDMDQTSSNGMCEIFIKISDTGIGIPKEDIGTICQPFRQGPQPQDLPQAGTGLGLAISKTLCEMMGGWLEIESKEGVGTTVSIKMLLPLIDSSLIEPMLDRGITETVELIPKYNFLIIDDHSTNRQLISQQLLFLGQKVSTASSGLEALKLLEMNTFDIIITDINMPKMNGMDFTTHFRKLEEREKRRRTLIIGLTADARQEQHQKAIEVGMDDCLFKPISLDQLKACIKNHDAMFHNSSPADIANSIQETLGKLTSENVEMIQSILINYMQASEEDLDNIMLASSSGDINEFLSLLHRIKGSARLVGADNLVMTCSKWEQSPYLQWSMTSSSRQIKEQLSQVKDGIEHWLKTNITKV
ncbi:MAG: response regulator [Aeromonas popoffii]|uniref:response regulator n=1 Tax=Aeromonas popoffii TaxID=70856 RepID=UPI003F36DC3B